MCSWVWLCSSQFWGDERERVDERGKSTRYSTLVYVPSREFLFLFIFSVAKNKIPTREKKKILLHIQIVERNDEKIMKQKKIMLDGGESWN